MVITPSAKEVHRQRWLGPALVAALLYPAVGIAFAFLDSASAASPVRFWRLAAWVVSAVVFGAHLVYEHRRLHNPPSRGARHAAFGVALGGFGLAIWVLVHGWWLGKTQSPTAPLALVLFPAITGIPAFLAGLATLAVASRLRRNR